MRQPAQKTLHLLVTCCKEPVRFEILEKVIEQLKIVEGHEGVLPHMIAFDNGSTVPGTIELVQTLGIPVYASTENLGYWSAIRWVLDHVDLTGYEFIHIIESDIFYYCDMGKIGDAERYMLAHPDTSCVRLQEYSVAEGHLYNKTLGRTDGRKYAWVSHRNTVTGQKVVLTETGYPEIYDSNFLAHLPALNRLSVLTSAFGQLGFDKRFSELDFQRHCHDQLQRVGVLDGGIFHGKLGSTVLDPRIICGSYTRDVSQYGYRTTRQDTILRYPEGTVSKKDKP
jgi:hypothetical protein